jgi:hypothetical protein
VKIFDGLASGFLGNFNHLTLDPFDMQCYLIGVESLIILLIVVHWL